MNVVSERIRHFLNLFEEFRHGLEIVSKIVSLSKLGIKQGGFTIDGVRYVSGDDVEHEKWLSRNIIYTLFLANLHSARLIAGFDQLDVAFHYADAKIIIRSMLERAIHQRYILTDPERLTKLFILWRDIEAKRFSRGVQKVDSLYPDSIVRQLSALQGTVNWTEEDEKDYKQAVQYWEDLVVPKQHADTARNWAGVNLSTMAEQCGLMDYYTLTYRSSSWYSHGLIHVSDFYLQKSNKHEGQMEYSIVPGELRKNECYLETLAILELSFYTTDEYIGWGVGEHVARIVSEKSGRLDWLRELARPILE